MIDNWISKKEINSKIEKFVEKHLLGKVSANQLTLTGLVLGLTCALSIFLSSIIIWSLEFIIISAILMGFSFGFDGLDGALARVEKPTIFGGILDMFCDRSVEVFIIIAIISTDPSLLMWPGIFSLGSIILCITVFLAIAGAIKLENLRENRKLLYYSHGIMERTETFLFLFIMTILIFLRFLLLWIFGILVFLTAIQRLRIAYIMFYKKSKGDACD